MHIFLFNFKQISFVKFIYILMNSKMNWEIEFGIYRKINCISKKGHQKCMMLLEIIRLWILYIWIYKFERCIENILVLIPLQWSSRKRKLWWFEMCVTHKKVFLDTIDVQRFSGHWCSCFLWNFVFTHEKSHK